MLYLILLIVGLILSETSGFNLSCTNDFDTSMSCHIDARNCTGLRLTLNKTKSYVTKACDFEPWDRGCSCEIKMSELLIPGYEFDAEVYKGGQSVLSQTVNVYETIKPQTPVIMSVDKSNEMYQIRWRTNAKRSILDELRAIVTYQKKGDTSTKHSEPLIPKTAEDKNLFDIRGQDLEPSTTYVVSVKTYTQLDVFSDSSKEVEFTTDSSRNGVFIAMILSLCVLAIVVSGVSFAFIIKLKGKLWDRAAKIEKPKPLDIKPKKEVILRPESVSIYSLSVEALIPKDSLMLSKESLSDSCERSGQSSGLSLASSSLDYANTEPVDSEACVVEALKNAFPLSHTTDSPGSGGPTQNCATFLAAATTTSLAFDNTSYNMCPNTTYDADGQVTHDSVYHSRDAPHHFINPLQVLNVEMDMSYQPCPQSEAADSHSFLPTVYGYQDFEKQSNNMLSENNSEYQSLITGLTNILQTSEVGHFQFGIPQVSNEIIVDSGYHSV